MKTVESERKGIRHLANDGGGITLCGLLRSGRWTLTAKKSRTFFDSPRSKRCETCTRIAARFLDRRGNVT